MPYIETRRRHHFDEDIASLCEELTKPDGVYTPAAVGEVNYVISKLVDGILGPEPRYADFNGVIGVLESAKLELYRRRVAPYEDEKKHEHGDVYQGKYRLRS